MRLKLNYLVIPLFTILIAYFGGRVTNAGMDWYKTINLPSFTPPGWVIGSVWTFIFICAALSALIAWNKMEHHGPRPVFITSVFIINGGLNFLWSYIFFGRHLIFTAMLEAGILGLSVLALITALRPVSRLASILLYPYFGWVLFATYLTYSIWMLNR